MAFLLQLNLYRLLERFIAAALLFSLLKVFGFTQSSVNFCNINALELSFTEHRY